VNHQATFFTYNLYLNISLMVIVDIRALNLEYLVKILNLSRSRYIFSDSDSTALLTGSTLSSPGLAIGAFISKIQWVNGWTQIRRLPFAMRHSTTQTVHTAKLHTTVL
jgi:hypothetical protein